MDEVILKGRKISGGVVEGEALVTHEDICFLPGEIDQNVGAILEKNHELEGVSFAGKILVFPTGKGSTAGSFGLYRLAKRNIAPKGIINSKAEAITAVGAIISDIPMIDRLDHDPIEVIKTGDYIKLDCDNGIVTIKRSPPKP